MGDQIFPMYSKPPGPARHNYCCSTTSADFAETYAVRKSARRGTLYIDLLASMIER